MLISLILVSIFSIKVANSFTFQYKSNTRFDSVCNADTNRLAKHSYTRIYMGRKIEDEEASINTKKSSSKRGNKNKKGGNDSQSASSVTTTSTQEATIKEASITSTSTISESPVSTPISSTSPSSSSSSSSSSSNPEPYDDISPYSSSSGSSFDDNAVATYASSNDNDEENSMTTTSSSGGRLRVPAKNPLNQNNIPPEVVFFGDPRQPPPGEAAQDTRFHGLLLYWARHVTVAPRDTTDRRNKVFLNGLLTSEEYDMYRIKDSQLSYNTIYEKFKEVMTDIEKSKKFINANIDQVVPSLFLRALTAKKLRYQYENNMIKMDELKAMRNQYILAHDQLFFPLNIEIKKSESRVMTYLTRNEFRNFAQTWDEVENTLYFLTLLTAKYTWDNKVKELLDRIRKKVAETVDYMAEGVKRDLMTREFRRPGITAEVYTNATKLIATNFPEIYSKITPEIKFIYETFNDNSKEDILRVANEICQKDDMAISEFKMRMKMLLSTLSSVQGTDYTGIRLRLEKLYLSLCTDDEIKSYNRWYIEEFKNGYGFNTYRPNEIPRSIMEELKYRDTGSAFQNFAVEILKNDPVPTAGFGTKRPTSDEAKDWLNRDSDYATKLETSYEAQIEAFRKAYTYQSTQRQEAEKRLMVLVENKMAQQDRILNLSSKKETTDDSSK